MEKLELLGKTPRCWWCGKNATTPQPIIIDFLQKQYTATVLFTKMRGRYHQCLPIYGESIPPFSRWSDRECVFNLRSGFFPLACAVCYPRLLFAGDYNYYLPFRHTSNHLTPRLKTESGVSADNRRRCVFFYDLFFQTQIFQSFLKKSVESYFCGLRLFS